MGIESANYLYVANAESSHSVATMLAALGAQSVARADGVRYVYSGPGFYIDLSNLRANHENYMQMSIRIALVNPLEAGKALKGPLGALFKESKTSYLLDFQTKKKWRAIDDEAWSDIWTTYIERRDEFRKNFGQLEAAISGDDVFRTLRESK